MANLNEHSKRPSSTKSGPGRYHSDGHIKARPHKTHGAPADFVLHTASAMKKERRQLVAKVGRRQAIKLDKLARSLSREWKAAPHD